ncbi:hypothetical protein ADEAN_000253900 [Angomonas deanei]|uniref:Uncharacterized protein n=1 Tax=Angomonas deanei TaxID=59799 RepID=A0A7G2C5R1_9TRYP|nr:hypothetical protein ADEAN_000253900 [Angomonas deanei]
MRKDFRTKVKQRAVTAAANSFQLQPDVVQQLVNESFANHNAGSSSNLTSTKDTNLSFSHPDQTSSDDEPEEHYRTDAVADEVANTITNASFAAVAADNNQNKSSNSPFNEGAGQRTAQQGKVKQVVLPFAELAENEEYINFVSNNRTFVQNLKPEEYTLSHDVNMIISMLVATDMFFGESERLLKTMYSVNRYAKSRMAPPVNSWRDIVDM